MTSPETPEAVTRPEHCAMGFGIPTSEPAFRDRSERPPAGHLSFVSRFDGMVPYWNQVIYPFQRLSPRYKRLGVRIAEDLTLAGFSALFRGEGVRAVILFSHWDEDAIELSDGFADAPAVVEAVPESYDGYLDLITCHPERLMPTLRHQRPRCNLVWVTTQVTPVLWLIFYQRLFQRLRRQPALYDDAQEAVLGERLVRGGRPLRERSA
jgi:hypothetical protein